MKSNQPEALSIFLRPMTVPQPPLNKEMIERGAQALFEFVFSGIERLDGKHLWMNCDDDNEQGFRVSPSSDRGSPAVSRDDLSAASNLEK